MKRKNLITRWSILIGLFFLLLSPLPGSATVPFSEQYQFLDLGECTPQALNGHGEVVGKWVSSKLFLWTPKEGMRIFEIPFFGVASSGINDKQQIIGSFALATHYAAFLWTEKEGFTNLGPLALPTAYLYFAYGINARGEIVGRASDSPVGPIYPISWEHAFLWTKQEDMQDLGTLPGGFISHAYAINNKSQIVGKSNIDHNSFGKTVFYAFLWTKQEGMQDLGTLPDGHDSEAKAINNHTQIVGNVGFVIAGHYQYRAFLWTEMAGMQDLAIPNNLSYFPHGINDSGQVVGNIMPQTTTYTNTIPFLWTEVDGIQDLNDLVEPLPQGGQLISADAINKDGQIIGQWLPPSGMARGYLLTPGKGKK